ncbi:helix-turn-helix transcriptional regulator [Pseudogracilibacillus auburnensis]|uniref:Putative transcriptional regulator n=1 Tax=Pseudogracilibacillus auburnensis TaxID=1494959 RepID=A0A2V3W6Y1_9BACI|nr:helix-turn-helix transcriptional regulator [Pseudogracilibacillus auburnensis]PXW88781.1 putative transcriptional regulator [Pseudogracilibacillus auburnensis]
MVLEKLKLIREKAGLTYQEVADKVGISKEYYWMIENGKRKLSYELAVKIAKVFNAKPDDIFFNIELTTSELNRGLNTNHVVN